MTNIYHPGVIESLRQLSDLDYQQRLWTGAIHGKIGDFVECYNQLFGDSALDVALEATAGSVYRDDIDRDLVLLNSLLDDLDIERSYREILDDPAMKTIAELAESILARLEPLDLPAGMGPGPGLDSIDG